MIIEDLEVSRSNPCGEERCRMHNSHRKSHKPIDLPLNESFVILSTEIMEISECWRLGFFRESLTNPLIFHLMTHP